MHWYFYVPEKEKREERRETRDERRETRDERQEMRDKGRGTTEERRETSERENNSAGNYTVFLNCLGQNEKSADFTGNSGIVCI